MYDGGLTTFPGTAIESAVTFEPVEGHAVVQPGEPTIESTSAEVDRVVSLVLDQRARRPHESLGVIALGIKHANRLDDAITAALRDAPDVADFFDADRDERFFVKNLERVQGDERDAIILSIGYGKTPHGRVLHRFGPLNIEGGERRLNVAITRARSRMTVVSSLLASTSTRLGSRPAGRSCCATSSRYAEARVACVRVPRAPLPTRPATRSRPTSPSAFAARAWLSTRTTATPAHRIDIAIEDPYHRGRVLARRGDGRAALRRDAQHPRP